MKIQKSKLEKKLKTLVKTKQVIIKKFDIKAITKKEYDSFMKEICDEITELNNKKIKIVQDKLNEIVVEKPIEIKPEIKIKPKIILKKIIKNCTKNVKFQTIPNKRYYVKKNTKIRKIIDLLKDSKINTELKVLSVLKYYYPKIEEKVLIDKIRDVIKSITYKSNKKLSHLEFDSNRYLIKETVQVKL